VRQELPPGEFITFKGRYPEKGEERAVRFKLYGTDVVSNVGKGRVDPKEIERCRGDSFAVRYGDFETVKAIAEGKVPTTQRDHIDVRPQAIRALARFKHARSVAVLEKLLGDRDPEIRGLALDAVAELGKLAESVIPLVEKLAKEDPESEVRTKAARTLRSLRGQK
jgi:HEAT repeat protein